MATARGKSKAAVAKAPKKAVGEVVHAFKAFDKDLKCRGFQYEVGKTYGPIDNIAMCERGFHSCTDPLDVLNYYDITSSRFATVKAGGAIQRKDDGDSKICSASITVVAELKLPDFIRVAVNATIAACKSQKAEGSLTSGDYAKNASSGHSASNVSSGRHAKNASSGDSAKNASSGDYAANVSSGGHAANVSSGGHATNASSGDYAKNASSGGHAKNASSGHSASNVSSGRHAKNASSGDYAKNASSGDYSSNEATGKHAVICGAGRGTRYKGAKGVWISAAEYKLVKGKYRCVGFATGQAGYGGVPADTWLIAKNGKLVEAA